VALLYSRTYLENRSILRGEYYVLALTALLASPCLVSANSLLTVYIGVELLALSVMPGGVDDSGISAEAAMKYFVLAPSPPGRCCTDVADLWADGDTGPGEIAARLHAPFSPGVTLGLVFIVVAVAFKLGAVPFHMWLPDVYEGAPTSVTLFIGTARRSPIRAHAAAAGAWPRRHRVAVVADAGRACGHDARCRQRGRDRAD